MNQAFKLFPAALSFCIAASIYADPLPDKICNFTSPESDQSVKVSPEFILSLALNEQSVALWKYYDKPDEKAKFNKSAIKYFNAYFDCLKLGGIRDTHAVSHFLKAISHYELAEYENSGQEIAKSIKINVRQRDAHFLQGRIFYKQGRLKESSDYIEKLLPMFSDDSDILFFLASINADLGNFSKAILYYSSLLDSIQNREGDMRYNIRVLKAMGDIYSRTGQSKKAIFYYKSYLNYNPSDIETSFAYAQILNNNGNFRSSKAELLKILEKMPTNLQVEQMLAEMYFIEARSHAVTYFESLARAGRIPKKSYVDFLFNILKGRHSESLDFFRYTVKNQPKRLSAHLALIEIYKKTGKFSEYSAELKETAEVAFTFKQFLLSADLSNEVNSLWQKHPELKGSYAQLYDFMASCYEESGFPNRALISIRKAIAFAEKTEEKESMSLHLAYILRLPGIKKYGESIEIVEKVIRENPGNAYANFLLGLNYIALEKYQESVQAFTRAIGIDPKNSNYFFYRASANEKQEKFKETAEDLKKAIEIDSNNSNAFNFLGYLYTERNIEKEEALSLIRKAVELEPDNGAFQDSLGWAYFKMDKLEDALHHLNLDDKMMIDRKEDDPVIFDHLGDLYLRKNDIVNAESFWSRALKLQMSAKDRERIRRKIKSSVK
ncbi:MAG: tetratricopeptide repeat protein [Leptospira sp.]|nr:tetratricopeptide repeat protein [Leptospira sp.]